MNLLLVLLVVLTLLSLPTWPYSATWGYFPTSGVGILLLVVLLLAFSRRRVL